MASDFFQAANSAHLLTLVKDLITLRASGYAFEASYQHLAIIASVAIFFVILIPYAKRKIKMPMH